MDDVPLSDREALLNHLNEKCGIRHKESRTVVNYFSTLVRFNHRTGEEPGRFFAWAKTVDPVEV